MHCSIYLSDDINHSVNVVPHNRPYTSEGTCTCRNSVHLSTVEESFAPLYLVCDNLHISIRSRLLIAGTLKDVEIGCDILGAVASNTIAVQVQD